MYKLFFIQRIISGPKLNFPRVLKMKLCSTESNAFSKSRNNNIFCIFFCLVYSIASCIIRIFLSDISTFYVRCLICAYNIRKYLLYSIGESKGYNFVIYICDTNRSIIFLIVLSLPFYITRLKPIPAVY